MSKVRQGPRSRMLASVVALVGATATGAAPADVIQHDFFSTALGGEMRYSVYVPPGYDDAGAQRYPVVYLLHGVGDNNKAWVKRGKVEESSDRLIASGELMPFIAVMPAAKTSWFVDSADVNGPGNYATAVREDLVRHIDETYRARTDRGGRAIAGLSMGGFGAIRLALEHPDTYVAAAGMSSALWLHVKSDTVLNERQERIFNGSFGTPFQAERFLRQSPSAYFEQAAALKNPPALYITAGDDDRFRAYRSSTLLYSAMREAGIEAQLRITDGDHVWPTWAAALPDVLRFFASFWAAAGGGGKTP
ncbi:MAG: alpha/beta hydrolase [Gammaproteobacteria bacterium]